MNNARAWFSTFLENKKKEKKNSEIQPPLWCHRYQTKKNYFILILLPLGKAQTAAVKRDAEIGVAQANRDAGIREAECEKAAMDVKYNTDTKIEDNSRAFKLQKANFDKEVNTAVSKVVCYVVVDNLWVLFLHLD